MHKSSVEVVHQREYGEPAKQGMSHPLNGSVVIEALLYFRQEGEAFVPAYQQLRSAVTLPTEPRKQVHELAT